MTKEQYDKSIETGELQLNWGNKLSHFGIVLFCFFIPVMLLSIHFINYIQGESATIAIGELWIILIPTILGCLFYWLQKSRIKFQIVETSLSRNKLLEVITEVGRELQWKKIHLDDQMYIAKTIPSFFSGSWGEQIIILFDKNRILINSICDLDKRPSVVSFGRNKKNEMDLIEAIKKAEAT